MGPNFNFLQLGQMKFAQNLLDQNLTAQNTINSQITEKIISLFKNSGQRNHNLQNFDQRTYDLQNILPQMTHKMNNSKQAQKNRHRITRSIEEKIHDRNFKNPGRATYLYHKYEFTFKSIVSINGNQKFSSNDPNPNSYSFQLNSNNRIIFRRNSCRKKFLKKNYGLHYRFKGGN